MRKVSGSAMNQNSTSILIEVLAQARVEGCISKKDTLLNHILSRCPLATAEAKDKAHQIEFENVTRRPSSIQFDGDA